MRSANGGMASGVVRAQVEHLERLVDSIRLRLPRRVQLLPALGELVTRLALLRQRGNLPLQSFQPCVDPPQLTLALFKLVAAVERLVLRCSA